jgi:uncharacterized membrane protein
MAFDPSRPANPDPFDPVQPPSFPAQPVVPVPQRTPLVKPRSSTRLLNAVLVVAAVVAVGGVSFAVGRNTAPVAPASARGNFPGGNFTGGFPGASLAPGETAAPGDFPRGGFGGGFGGGVTILGTVTSVTGDTLTVTTAAGQAVQFSLTSDTGYHSQADATVSDVKPGATVEVQLELGVAVGRPTASADASGPLGTASSVTVVP